MGKKLTRRKFVLSSAAAGILAVQPSVAASPGPQVITGNTVKPVVISAANGNRFKNGGDVTCVEKAFRMITAGADVLDAVIAGVNIVELDPEDTSVGYGGLPNADGVVQLDASVMHGPKKRAGAVAARSEEHTSELQSRGHLVCRLLLEKK